MFSTLVGGMVSQVYAYVQIHQDVCIKCVDFLGISVIPQQSLKSSKNKIQLSFHCNETMAYHSTEYIDFFYLKIIF